MTEKMILACALVLSAALAYGEQKDGFWDKLQYKLEKVTPAKKGSATTAVGGVRGAKNDEATDVYWKGKDKTSEVNEDEMLKFNLALESKLKGDNELALKQFEEFLSAYPQSTFRVEGLQAVEKIRVEMAAKNALNTAPAVSVPAPPADSSPGTPVVQPPAAESAPEPLR